MTRTSTRSARAAPSGRISRSCSTRSSLACSAGDSSRDLVEEHRAAVGLDEQAGAIGARVGERAALVAEELALEQRVGDRRAVDGDERPRLARAVEVDRRATSSLPVPDSPVTSTDAAEPATRRTRSNTSCIAGELADDVLEAVAARDLVAQPRDLGPQLALGERLLDRQDQLVDLERLGDVVERAQLHRADRGVDRAERGDGDDVGRRARPP